MVNETDIQCMNKVRSVVSSVPGIDAKVFRINRCHRLDGPFRQGGTC